MEIKTSEVIKQNVFNFSKRYLELLQQKKIIDQDIKALKEEFKEEGIAVGIVTRIINKIKTEKKKSDAEKFEAEKIQEWLEANSEIDNKIGELVAK